MTRRILSVVGARPNFMKIAPIHRAFETFGETVSHGIVHTGQHYDAVMSDAFFEDLKMPDPVEFLGVGSGSHGAQTAAILVAFEQVVLTHRPDLVLVAGDVNSTVACALAAVKLGVPVGHVEAGLRSFDRGMPEEINRMATDAISDYAFVTEPSGLQHLAREGWDPDRVHFIGNPMIDSQRHALEHAPAGAAKETLDSLGITPGGYVLVTLHRPSNVDDAQQLAALLDVLVELCTHRTVVLPLHPRTRQRLERFGLMARAQSTPHLILAPPQGYLKFLALQQHADFVITDSGGIQEETTALGVPCLTCRTTTERPVTCTLGTNTLVDPSPDALRQAIDRTLNGDRKAGVVPPLWDGQAATRLAQIVVEQIL
ncbi:MAG: non-hydrolyzing UDP-N-acetylglucosamine 2-epimerase [Bradymonadia bacterium]